MNIGARQFKSYSHVTDFAAIESSNNFYLETLQLSTFLLTVLALRQPSLFMKATP
jgi:hypothetical protein